MINKIFVKNLTERIKEIEQVILYSCIPEELLHLRDVREEIISILDDYKKIHSEDDFDEEDFE